MSRESADADIKEILQQTQDLLDLTLDGFKDSYFGTPYGQHALNDAMFLLWFEDQMKDGLWPLAWQFVEGGMKDIERWERLTGQKVPRVADMIPMLQATGATINPEMWPIPLGEGGPLSVGANVAPPPVNAAIPQ